MPCSIEYPEQLKPAFAIFRVFGYWDYAIRKALNKTDLEISSLMPPENRTAKTNFLTVCPLRLHRIPCTAPWP
jgi:hypothetical protein